MTPNELMNVARGVAPALDWVLSVDGDGLTGTGSFYAGANVGLEGGNATINFGNIGGFWVAELMRQEGSLHEGDDRALAIQITLQGTASQAWEALLDVCTAAGSLPRGLQAAQDAMNEMNPFPSMNGKVMRATFGNPVIKDADATEGSD